MHTWTDWIKHRWLMIVLIAFMLIVLFAVLQETQRTHDTFLVYLQAGHSPSNLGIGAYYNDVRESVLNEELTQETYQAILAKDFHVILLNPIYLYPDLPSIIQDPPGEDDQYAFYSPEPAMLTAISHPEQFNPPMSQLADLVLSLHHNASDNPETQGYEIYYSAFFGGDYERDALDAVLSEQAATLIAESLASTSFDILPSYPIVRENSENNGITKNSPVPSVLIEMGYMSNEHDFAAAQESNNKDMIAGCLADAVSNYYISLNYPALFKGLRPVDAVAQEESLGQRVSTLEREMAAINS